MVNQTKIITHHQPEHFDYDLIRLAQSVNLPSIWSGYTSISMLTIAAASGFFRAGVRRHFFLYISGLFI